jgi:hypothetical protein
MTIIEDPWSRYIVRELWPLTAGKNKGQGWKPYKSNLDITHKINKLAPQIKNLGRTRIHKNLNIALNTGHIGKKAVLGWANQNVANRKKHFYHILDVAIGGAERNKFKKLINSGANISHTNRQRIDLVYNNLSKELKARNEAAKTANTVAIRKELASILELNNVEKIKPRVTKLNSTFKHWRKQVNSGNFEKLKLKLAPKKSIPALEAFNAQIQLKRILSLSNKASINNNISKLNKNRPGWRNTVNKNNLRALDTKLNSFAVTTTTNNAVTTTTNNAKMSNNKGTVKPSFFSGIFGKANQKPANQKPANQKPANQKPANQKPANQKPANQKPANQKPANQKPSIFSGMFDGAVAYLTKPANKKPNFLPVEYTTNSNGITKPRPPPMGYALKSVYTNGKQTTGYYLNKKARASQIEHSGYGPAPKLVGSGPMNKYVNNYGNNYVSRYGNNYVSRYGNNYVSRYGNRYGNNYVSRYGNRYGNKRRGPGAPSGGIVFAPKINVGAARIGAQTFGGTRVGGQQMGGSHVRTGNTGSTTLKTGNTGGTSAKTGNTGGNNAGRLAVSSPTTNGSRQLAATPEQLIRGAGGAEAVEKGINALNAANGNVTRAKAASKLPNNTFTNIYAMGGPVAAKRLVEQRRRRRTVGGTRGLRVASKKKRVARKPKKYIKLTPYQFKRLTDHIKKNNLRRVLIKEITH